MTALLIESLVKIAVLIFGLLTAAAYLVLLERRVAAWVQDRLGPNRVGIPLTRIRLFGLGQPLADGVKFLLKEAFTPSQVDRVLYVLAPISILVAALVVFAVIPIGSVLPPLSSSPDAKPIPLVVAPGLNVGMLFVLAVGSVAVYGVILGGWASNNKYSFLGALRSSAQLIAYELPLGLGVLGVVLAAGSLDLNDIIRRQAESGLWFAIAQPLGFLVFAVAAFAEAARLPFDLPEAEQELIGGYHTEYGGIKLLLFLVAEFLHMVAAAFLIVILFLGGWHFWGLTGAGDSVTWPVALLRVFVLWVKVGGVILFFMLVRWSWPRFRFDQLMALAWKVMLPLGIVNVVAVAVLDELREPLARMLGSAASAAIVLAAWAICVAAWVVAALCDPLVADNRPRRDLAPYEIDTQI
jgi:NADH-quinone oxidoreductase subunit H